MAFPLQKYLSDVSQLVFGCMGLGGNWEDDQFQVEHLREAEAAVETALECGINCFDHADIYSRGKAESVFGQLLAEKPHLRDKMFIQSKAGIRLESEPPRYDFSGEWLRQQLDRSLRQLKTDYLDVWLLHRPDPLMEPEIVAEVFEEVHAAGKARFFGVSNMHHHQIDFLQSFLDQPLVVNQLEMSLARLDWLHQGVLAGNVIGKDVNFTAGTMEYCQRNNVQLQAWGSLAQGRFSGRDITGEPEEIGQTAQLVAEMANKYKTSREAIVLAWLMRHPAGIQPVIGTIKPKRIKACAAAEAVALNRQDWYKLYISAYGRNLP